MADFDPFANQGGPAAWDPEHAGDAKKHSDELLRRLAATEDEPGSGPSKFSDEEPDGESDLERLPEPDAGDDEDA
ncbi:hypothetical protein GCM10022239_01940 [Leifsonia bigeumensis]|uniref:Uncharacterized protein n=1 Tax=Leifsonella bigeumensis TaxID=433643 RepID=A0ABP7F3F9_9MICO